MQTDFQVEIEQALARLTQKPEHSAREYVCHGTTIGAVYQMAGQILSVVQKRREQVDTICLAAEDKALIAAAILASLGGGPPLLLPFAVSERALYRIHKQGLLDTVITDMPRDIPTGVQVITPADMRNAVPVQLHNQGRPQAELLRIYTGGTTGSPQIWPKSRANLVGEGIFLQEKFALTEKDIVLATVPPYHIYGLLFSIILPLVSSAAVVGETPSFPGEIADAVASYGVTVMASVPPHYRVLGSKALGLRLAFSSAGMLAEDDNGQFCQANSSGIVEVYGSTETGGIATRNRYLGEENFTPFSIIDWKRSKECLAIRSPFISPDLPVDKNGFFTTSDRIEMKGQNTFGLKGRADSVTKVGGKRVDLEEICLVIKKHEDVEDCVVTSFADQGGREGWIAALVQGSVAVDELRNALAEELETYALPRRIKTVDAIPVQANGKYDRAAIQRLLR